MYLGGSFGNGLCPINARTSGEFSNSLASKFKNHRFSLGLLKAANHICQSNLGWKGATKRGFRFKSPGLYLNS